MPPKSQPSTTTAGEFLREALGSLSCRLREAADGLPNPGAVHDLRVSARRLRSLLSNFQAFLPTAAEEIRAQLKALAGGFSEARDLDVMLDNLRAWRRKLEPEHKQPFKDVLAGLAARRAERMRAACAVLDAWRGTAQEAKLKLLAQHGEEWPEEASVPVRMVALGQLTDAQQEFRKALMTVRRDQSREHYHELRIRGKQLRYVLQALTDVYGKPARPMLKDLEALQDGFGAYLDAEVAAETLEQGLTDMSGEARKAASRMADICRSKASKRLKAMPGLVDQLDEKRWKHFLDSVGDSG